jgi:MFS family permease
MSVEVTNHINSPTIPDPSRWFVFNLIAAYFALSMALLTPPMMTIAMRVAQIAPENKEHVLGLLLGIGSVVAILANPLAGYFSDRTKSSWGKRKIWMVMGTLVGTFGLGLIAWGGVAVMVVGWCLTQLGLNAVAAALMALLPDKIPQRTRGLVSGALGMTIPAGILAGIALTNLTDGNVYAMFLIEPAILLIAVLVLCASYHDLPCTADSSVPFSLRRLGKDFYFNPLAQLDFTWAFISRFMFFMAMATFFGYQVYFLMDRLGYEVSAIPEVMLKLNLVTSGIQIGSSFLSGWLSDRMKNRKFFIWTSAAMYGLGLVLVAYSNDYNSFLLGASVMSCSFGVYLAVDMALVTEVLPDPENNAAKDLGIFNIAGTMPQTLAPAIAPIFLFMGHADSPNYNALFLAAAVYAVLGAWAIFPIKGVR